LAEEAATEGREQGPPALDARGIAKRFGSVVACDQVDFAVERGEIHGVLGQNGAGKTTLMNVLLGLVRPDAGEVYMDGRPVAIRDPLEAAAAGIAMVHQHFSLINALTVWENITLGERGRVDRRASARRVADAAERYGLTVDPNVRVQDLTTGQRQRVEILKCLLRDPQVLILDEPTSVLTAHESFELFGVLRQVVHDEQRAVVLISHKLDEILFATDRVTIMRNGAVVAREMTADTDAARLAREMIGRPVALRTEAAALGHLEIGGPPAGVAVVAERVVEQSGADVVLAIRDAVTVGPDGHRSLDGLSLTVRRGEVVGLAGVEGNGQRAVGDLLCGLIDLVSGSVDVDGRAVPCGHPGCSRDAGIGVISEDRHTSGCIMDMSVAENLVMTSIESVLRGRFVSRRRMNHAARRLVDEFDIKVASLDAPMRSLSGGNQQKLVLARELSTAPKVLVAAQPTRGLDVGAIEYMIGRLRDVAASGVGVLLISTELEEILDLADRIAVIHRGRIMGEMARRDADVDRIGLMMGGQAA
jgi:simple sugar transport system ATP-binding protein